MFEELTVDVEVIDTQPVPGLGAASRDDTVDQRPPLVSVRARHDQTRPTVLPLGDGPVATSHGQARTELALLVRALRTADDAQRAQRTASRARRFLFGAGLLLDEEERRVLGRALTCVRRRWGSMHSS